MVKSEDYDQKPGDREKLLIFRERLTENPVDLVTVITVSRKVRPANWKNRHFFIFPRDKIYAFPGTPKRFLFVSRLRFFAYLTRYGASAATL